jgi:hypothetical protein
MPRADQPVSSQEAHDAYGDYYPNITAEIKPQDYGRIHGKVVALDYGFPLADMVKEKRSYYGCKSPGHVA